MNQDDFIKGIKVAVHDAAIQAVAKTLAHPPGRRPHAKLKRLSDWFNALPDGDKKALLEIIRQSVHASIFNILCVLDGVVPIESTPVKGELRLTFLKDGRTTKLNGPEMELLHDIYQVMVQQEVFEE